MRGWGSIEPTRAVVPEPRTGIKKDLLYRDRHERRESSLPSRPGPANLVAEPVAHDPYRPYHEIRAMSVYFVYRSHYEGPSGKHVRRLSADSVLGWFQAVWERAKQANDASEWVSSELGCSVYGFESIFEAARDESLPPPTSDRKLKSYLEEHLHVEGEILYAPHALQVLTDDDEIELASYFFDDDLLNKHPGRAAYLLHEDWRLTVTSGERPYAPAIETKTVGASGDGPGTTYLAFLAFYDSMNLDLDGPWRIDGVRLPGLTDYLRGATPGESWPFELKLIRSQLPPDDSAGTTSVWRWSESPASRSIRSVGRWRLRRSGSGRSIRPLPGSKACSSSSLRASTGSIPRNRWSASGTTSPSFACIRAGRRRCTTSGSCSTTCGRESTRPWPTESSSLRSGGMSSHDAPRRDERANCVMTRPDHDVWEVPDGCRVRALPGPRGQRLQAQQPSKAA